MVYERGGGIAELSVHPLAKADRRPFEPNRRIGSDTTDRAREPTASVFFVIGHGDNLDDRLPPLWALRLGIW